MKSPDPASAATQYGARAPFPAAQDANVGSKGQGGGPRSTVPSLNYW
jgi:hypothetical protein